MHSEGVDLWFGGQRGVIKQDDLLSTRFQEVSTVAASPVQMREDIWKEVMQLESSFPLIRVVWQGGQLWLWHRQ